ncbi:hypothetical protein [Streptomyces sp. MZ04]|uniref:hypothetical protein n=1 Tax=Streptomyces sp. MZ04 TaxID=2559236 RepID=UPI00107EE6CA|nr:hypothetical protein [Streptomyces sp. MZ04]TGB16054.1 hypothetical protein E2651_01000 [Streptomyces sp. MZ04]
MADPPQAGLGRERQAVVIVHGMGEQRPLDALTGFIRAGLPPVKPDVWEWEFDSRPDIVSDSFESRRFVAPAQGARPQTEFFEYHWAHLMQGNRLWDMVPTFFRLLCRLPRPPGLRFAWAASWAIILFIGWKIYELHPVSSEEEFAKTLFTAILGTGVVGVALLILVTKVVPQFITSSLVDVVRYLDTSPRSYAVRHDIRQEFIDLLKELHNSKYRDRPRYQRIIIVAHSLGAYIAYDGISYLWGEMNNRTHAGVTGDPPSLADFQEQAAALPSRDADQTPTPDQLSAYRNAQRTLWKDLRARGNQWLITDFISCGTPMYFADLLYARNRKNFEERVSRHELVTCPPVPQTPIRPGGGPYTYRWKGAAVLNDWSPFAVVRWTNLWFPAAPSFFGIFGDWFGGPLRRLFGSGIDDIPVRGNRPKRLIPAYAHALYFKFPKVRDGDSVTKHLADALDLTALRAGPAQEQRALLLALLPQAGFPPEVMSREFADFLGLEPDAPVPPLAAWLDSLSVSGAASCIDALNRRIAQM